MPAADARTGSRWGPQSKRDSTEGLSLSRLAGLPTDYWESAKQEAKEQIAKAENTRVGRYNDNNAFVRAYDEGQDFGVLPGVNARYAIPNAAEKEFQLQSILASLEGLDEEQLYCGILDEEERVMQMQQSQRDTESTLRAELAKLSTEVNALQMQNRDTHLQAEDLANDDQLSGELQHDANQMRKQIVSLRRGLQATEFYSEKAKKQQATRQDARLQLDMQERDTRTRQHSWQRAMDNLNATATRLEKSEKEKEQLMLSQHKGGKKVKSIDPSEIEFRHLMEQQKEMLKQLNESRNAQELKKLLEEERKEFKTKRATATVVIEEIADLEERTDIVERRSQRHVEDLREALVRGSSKEVDLQRAKAQADEWLQSMWSTICQQKREQLMLHQRLKEEDLWASHLQARTDQLVEELKTLEEDVADVYDPMGDPVPNEEKLEEEMWADLQLIRQKRRAAQHKLAYHLSKRKPLLQAMSQVKDEYLQLMATLEPIKGLLNER